MRGSEMDQLEELRDNVVHWEGAFEGLLVVIEEQALVRDLFLHGLRAVAPALRIEAFASVDGWVRRAKAAGEPLAIIYTVHGGTLTEPKNAVLRQYQASLKLDKVDLVFEPDAIDAIADKAIAQKTGARGLRSILESILLDTMFDLPTLEGVEEVVISAEVVEGKARPLYIYAERQGDIGT
ncbi:MAG: hypothetical protein CVT71_01440, partial [Alphaproteobacteria bacterium HGW-Alphaproteobacteria-10]